MPKVNLKVPKRSGFDKSHSKLLTAKCGTLIPILVDELIPNTKVHLDELISAQLPPLATDTFMRVNLKLEAFFCPTRLVYAGYEKWLTREKIVDINQTQYDVCIPRLSIPASTSVAGTLADYLGVRSMVGGTPSPSYYVNIFPFLVYHHIWNSWYRNTQVQRDIYFDYVWNQDNPDQLYNLPYHQMIADAVFTPSSTYADGVALNSLRQRNFGFDYFTTAMPTAQLGAAQKVKIENPSTANASFTIAALRAANSLQQFAERNQMAGYRLVDYVRANYGANLSNGVAQRPICLGSAEIPVYSKGVYQTNNGTNQDDTNNPFGIATAAKFGDATANGNISLIKDFVADEPGYLMVMASLVPIACYASGIDRMMFRYNAQNSQTDLATPLLQNVGNQPIYQGELTGTTGTSVFGYTDRYADFKQKQSSIHGLLRDSFGLESFALQRNVTGSPTISDSFLKIPTNYMDQICATNENISGYGVWINAFHNYKVSMPLAEYSIPSLQDPAYEHGNDVQVEIGGSRF